MLQHPTVWFDRKQLKYLSKELLLYNFLHKRSTWCLKDCDKQRLQTTVSINLWKIFAGHTGDWFDVKTASICTTQLWDALKSFILTSLKIKVAPYPIIVSLDTLREATFWMKGQRETAGWFVIFLFLPKNSRSIPHFSFPFLSTYCNFTNFQCAYFLVLLSYAVFGGVLIFSVRGCWRVFSLNVPSTVNSEYFVCAKFSCAGDPQPFVCMKFLYRRWPLRILWLDLTI